jgi:hypothetical protein
VEFFIGRPRRWRKFRPVVKKPQSGPRPALVKNIHPPQNGRKIRRLSVLKPEFFQLASPLLKPHEPMCSWLDAHIKTNHQINEKNRSNHQTVQA